METGTAISFKEVADLLFAARGRIDFYWNFYVVVLVAIIGWLVSLKKSLTVPMKALVSVAFLIAAVMNFLGLASAYTLAEALRGDLLRMPAPPPLRDTRLILEQHSFLMQRTVALWVHLAVGTGLLLVVWLAPFGERQATTPQPAGLNEPTADT